MYITDQLLYDIYLQPLQMMKLTHQESLLFVYVSFLLLKKLMR